MARKKHSILESLYGDLAVRPDPVTQPSLLFPGRRSGPRDLSVQLRRIPAETITTPRPLATRRLYDAVTGVAPNLKPVLDAAEDVTGLGELYASGVRGARQALYGDAYRERPDLQLEDAGVLALNGAAPGVVKGLGMAGRGVGRLAVKIAPEATAALGRGVTRALDAVPGLKPVSREELMRYYDRPEFAINDADGTLHVARKDVVPETIPDLPTDINKLRVIMRQPENNPALRMANDLSIEHRGVPFSLDEPMPVTSLQRQSGIARAFQAALEGSPEYKHAVFEAYGNQMPQVVEQAGAQNYDQLMEGAYHALGDEAAKQFDRLPVRMQYHNGEGEYGTPSAMFRDVLGNGNLNVFRGGDPHEFLQRIDPVTGLSQNEMFRADHDFIGHVAPGSTFRPGGEEIAYATHARTLPPLAQLALLSETRGQNSLVNYSGLNADLLSEMKPLQQHIEALREADRMRGRPGASAAEIADIGAQLRALGQQTQFAPQKTVLLPPEYIDPMTPGGIPDWLQPIIKPRYGSAPERAVHLSHTPDLAATDPAFYGTGHRGDDWAVRGRKGSPESKTSFYLGDNVRPERMVEAISPHAYETQLSGLYDIAQDPEQLVKLSRAYNLRQSRMGNGLAHIPDLLRMVKEYGYSGIRNPEFMPGQGAADVFGPVDGLTPITRGANGYARGGLAVRRCA